MLWIKNFIKCSTPALPNKEYWRIDVNLNFLVKLDDVNY